MNPHLQHSASFRERATSLWHRSTSWRITKPIRALKRLIIKLRPVIGQWIRILYIAVPLPIAVKLRIKSLVFTVFSPFLRNTASYRAWLPFKQQRWLAHENIEYRLGLRKRKQLSLSISFPLTALENARISWSTYRQLRRFLADYKNVAIGSFGGQGPADLLATVDTERIVRYAGSAAFPETGTVSVRRLACPKLTRLLSVPARAVSSLEVRLPLTFAVITTFYSHTEFFERCAWSVDQLRVAATDAFDSWIVVNDDPALTKDQLLRLIPPSLRDKTQILSDGKNRGISRRLNEGVSASSASWLLFVDCDDLIMPWAIEVLARHIARYPGVRYVSSLMMDIDANGHILRYRTQPAGPEGLVGDGMTAGHLKAIRSDAFKDLGLFVEGLDGCQDYDFALRLAAKEPILYIPDFLYAYRWHPDTQSISKAQKQNITTEVVLQRFCLEQLELAGAPWTAFGRCGIIKTATLHGAVLAVLIRTQSDRMDYLEQAVHSVLNQCVPTQVFVIVHGDVIARDRVAEALRSFSEHVRVLHATDISRKRGYPLNVALDELYTSNTPPAVLAFLDDDDIFYPMFAEKVMEAMCVTGTDVVCVRSNRRKPSYPVERGYGTLPIACLIAVNFIPINGYCIRFESIMEAKPYFDETLDYLEDWDFLVKLLALKLDFFFLEDTLSEFRITGDGNIATKCHPELWAACDSRVCEKIQDVVENLGAPEICRRLLDINLQKIDAALINGILDSVRAIIGNKGLRVSPHEQV